MKKLIAATAFSLLASNANASSDSTEYVMNGLLNGQVFIMDQDHMSLYFLAHEVRVPRCYDECAVTYPPAILPADTDLPQNYTLIERKDGQMQITYKGKPLYRYSGDSAIGDINGDDGLGGVWSLARPE